jgi:uncharacterized membrane protein YfcA
MHAMTDQTVDVVLALILIVGGVVGAQAGTRTASRMRGDQLRIAFSVLTLAIAIQLLFGLVRTPADIYSTILGAG